MNFLRTFEPVKDSELAESIIASTSTFWYCLSAIKLLIGTFILISNLIDKRVVSLFSVIVLFLGALFLLFGYLLRKYKSISISILSLIVIAVYTGVAGFLTTINIPIGIITIMFCYFLFVISYRSVLGAVSLKELKND